MTRRVVDLRRDKPYWDERNEIRYQAQPRRRYDLRILGEALLFALALFAVIVATSGLEPRV